MPCSHILHRSDFEVQIIVPKVTNNLKRFNWVNRAWQYVSEYIGIGAPLTGRERRGVPCGNMKGYGPVGTTIGLALVLYIRVNKERQGSTQGSRKDKNKRRCVCPKSPSDMTEGLLWDLMNCGPLLHGKTDRDKFASRRKGIQSHRKEDVHRERCPGKPTSSWAVGLSAWASDGVRKWSKKARIQPQGCWWVALLSQATYHLFLSFSLSLIHRTEHDVYPSPLLPELFVGALLAICQKRALTL